MGGEFCNNVREIKYYFNIWGIRKKKERRGLRKRGGENSPISPPLDPRLLANLAVVICRVFRWHIYSEDKYELQKDIFSKYYYWVRLSRIQIKEGSAYPTKAKFNNCFIIHSKYFPILKGVLPFRSLFFCSPKVTISSPGFLDQGFINLRQAALLMSFWCHQFIIICSGQHFWCHPFNMTKVSPNFVNSSWLWGIVRVVLTNQKRGNILNE